MGERQAASPEWRRRNNSYNRDNAWQQDRNDPFHNNYSHYNRDQIMRGDYGEATRYSSYSQHHGSNSSSWRSGTSADYYTPHESINSLSISSANPYISSRRYYSTQDNGSGTHDSYQYERRPYRPRENYSDYGSSTRSNAGTSMADSTRSHTTKSGSSSKHRVGYSRNNVRRSYHQGTFEVPANYPTDREPPEPLPLLVLDLNGTLVCRDAYSGSGNSSARSKRPVARPYMKSFLQYCLGIASPGRSVGEYQDIWDVWEHCRKTSRDEDAPHGSQFWQDEQEPLSREGATFRLLLWSSAQPHNVDSMAKAILSPEQAEQLIRVYARDTLVTKRLYAQKAPSVKDLEILWTVLNSRHIGPEAEARLFAESRDAEDKKDPDEDSDGDEIQGGGAAYEAALKASNRVLKPKERSDGIFEKGKGYGQHNTILLDDSIDKARLQPFNHVLVGEFDRAAALKVNAAREKHIEEHDLEKGNEDDIDDVLLQMIGVLEHARYQVNISSWIRFGGLGDFAGKRNDHPYFNEDENEDNEVDHHLVEKAVRYFSKSESSGKVNRPRLRTPINDRSKAFWIKEGKKALSRHNIPLLRF